MMKYWNWWSGLLKVRPLSPSSKFRQTGKQTRQITFRFKGKSLALVVEVMRESWEVLRKIYWDWEMSFCSCSKSWTKQVFRSKVGKKEQLWRVWCLLCSEQHSAKFNNIKNMLGLSANVHSKFVYFPQISVRSDGKVSQWLFRETCKSAWC